ncbi:RES family NAD+ phosphorylase (plasmid) [Pseudomonas silesiensis]|uniref:RES family NAD+ phosphorylase n=1 Tax=Pseudomonas silesiensis TaxID=1853130 RepID=UPI0030CC60BE
MSNIKAYRLVKKKNSSRAFNGVCAGRFGGRWHSKGRDCLYFADSPALSVLEVFVHLGHDEIIQSYDLFELTLPSKMVLRANPESLPESWRSEPASQETAAFGDAWIDTGSSLALAVPSVIVPQSWNYLINIQHSEFVKAVETAHSIDFTFNGRLAKK